MERIRLRFRCDLRWDELEGDDARERRCGECGQNVINLSSLTRPAAERLVAERVRAHGLDKVCVRFVQDAEGRVEYASPIEPRRRLRLLGELGAAAALATVISLPRAASADLSSEANGKPGATATLRRADPPKQPAATTTTMTTHNAEAVSTVRQPPPKRPLMGKPAFHPRDFPVE